MNSTHLVEVVEVFLSKHSGADSLSLTRAFDYQVVVRSADWKNGALAAYIPPDSLVDVSRPEFSFLADRAKSDGKARIRAIKLRGERSFGLLVPAPAGSKVGDDVTEALGVEHYDPLPELNNSPRERLFASGETAPGPSLHVGVYDLESGRKYGRQAFEEGEPVYITEKLHGQNCLVVFWDGQLHVRSRTRWKKEFPSYDHLNVDELAEKVDGGRERAEEIIRKLKEKSHRPSVFWQGVRSAPSVIDFCQSHPGYVVFGEQLGSHDLHYGLKKGEVSFRVFDIMKEGGNFIDGDTFWEMVVRHRLPTVPLLGEKIPFSFEQVCELAEGKSTLADHVREGCVVRPIKEKVHPKFGRTCLKWVGGDYLSRKA